MTVEIQSPVFKGSQAPKATKGPYVPPVSKMHAQIM